MRGGEIGVESISPPLGGTPPGLLDLFREVDRGEDCEVALRDVLVVVNASNQHALREVILHWGLLKIVGRGFIISLVNLARVGQLVDSDLPHPRRSALE